MAPKQKPRQERKAPDAPPRGEAEADQDVESALSELFATLDKHIKSNSVTQIIKTSEDILALSPHQHDAIHCKLVALIHSDQIEPALDFIQSLHSLDLDLRFQKAYCLYRKNHLVEALEILRSLEKTSSVLQLEAQILYRQNAMDSCIKTYEAAVSNFQSDSLEVKTNFTAAYISAGRYSEVLSLIGNLKISPTSTFELAYNAACALIDRGEFAEAQNLLLRARTIGQEMLTEEDLTEEEIECELSPITVQLAYVQQILGNYDDAVESYIKILQEKKADPSTLAVATNNLIALKGNEDIFDGLKKIDKLVVGQKGQLADGLEMKLSNRQKEAIHYNRALLLLYANKLQQARELVSSLISMYPENLAVVLLQAALLVKENKHKLAEEILQKFSQGHPKESSSAYLARAQIAALGGHYQVAAESLQEIPDIQNHPATVATLVSLKEKANDITGADAVFDVAVKWWKSNMGEDQQILEQILNQAAVFKLKHKMLEDASSLFEQLVQGSSTVREEALIGLVQTMSHSDVAEAEKYEKQLPPLKGLSTIDITTLEKSSGANANIPGKHTKTAEDTLQREDSDKTKKKRKRKPKYPKGYDPANPGPAPHPERWLPKRERSNYRPNKKGRRTGQVRGSQGSVARERPEQPTNGPSTSKMATATGKSSSSDKPSTSGSQKGRRRSRR